MAKEARKRLVRLNVLNGTTYQDAGDFASALFFGFTTPGNKTMPTRRPTRPTGSGLPAHSRKCPP